jgi:subfamily B ATP-binding cassette protein MsbA
MSIFLKIKKLFFFNFTFLKKNTFDMIKYLWVKYIYHEWKLLIISIIFMGLYSIFNVFSISLLKPVFDKVFVDKNINVLMNIANKIIIVFGLKSISQYIQSISMTKLGLNFTKKLQHDLYNKFINQDLEFYNENNSADLLVYFSGDLVEIRHAVIKCVTAIVRDVCSIIFLIVLMFWKSFDMALAMFIIFPIGFYPVIYFGEKIKKIFIVQQKLFGRFYSLVTQSFRGIRIIKSYNMEDIESKKIENNIEEIVKTAIKMAKNNNILSPLMEFFGGIAAAGTLFYGGYRILRGTLTTGDFVVFLIAIVAAYQPMKSLATLNSSMQLGVASINRIFEIMNKKIKIVDIENAKTFRVTKGIIKFENVKFGYINNIEILHNINLEINEGEKIALVGAAGSGKSTLIDLILRFYDVDSGSISIDGEDIRKISIKSLRHNISFVSQDVVLFEDTIKKNILIGNPNASDNDAIIAAKNAAAHDFIMKQNYGYDTVVGEMGNNLSGGQKQMISIARAMLKNAKILLLDEATSSLDSKSEDMVQKSLEKLMIGRTSIFISHRLSTIINSDKIYVFDSGNIVESGTHYELLKFDGYYKNLYELQFNK